MSPVLDSIEYMYYVAFILSWTLNILLLYIVKKYTTKQMKVFSSIVIQTIVLDMVSSLILTLGQVQMEATLGYVFMAPGVSFIDLPGKLKCCQNVVYGITANANFWSIPIQAIYRYITVVQKRHVPAYYPAMIYFTVILISIVFATVYGTQLVPIEISADKDVITQIPFWANNDVHKFCMIPTLSSGVLVYIFMFISGNACGVAVLLWTTRELNKTLKGAKEHLSTKTLQMHREMTKKIFAQTILPCISGIIMIFICAMPFVLENYYGGLFLWLFVPFPWVDVVNPLLTLICIQRYRQVVVTMILRRHVSTSTVVVPIKGIVEVSHIEMYSR